MADKFQLKAILSAVDKISPTLRNVQRGIKLTHKTLRDIGNAGGELMRKIGIPAFLSFSAITYGAIRATRAALDYASGIQDASDRTGAGVENFQAVANMLGLVGGTAEDAEMAFTKFNKGIAEAAAGKDPAFAGLLKKLKIPLKDAKGQLVGLTDSLPDLAKGFAKNKNPAIQTRMAIELWGKGGTKMIPVMNGLADGSISLADALKMIVDKKSISDLDNMGDSLTSLGTKAKVTLTSALAKMVPVIQPIIDSMSKWISANKELIQTSIVNTLTEVATALQAVKWNTVISDLKETAKTISSVVNALGGVKGIVIGLGLAFIAGPIAAILSIGGALFRFSTGMFALIGPWAILIAAIVAGGVLIYKNWSFIGPLVTGSIGGLNSSFGSLWASIKNLAASLKDLWKVLGPILLPVLKVIGFIVGQVFLLAFEMLVLTIKNMTFGIKMLVDSFSRFYGIASSVLQVIKQIAGLIVPDWVKKLFGGGNTTLTVKAPPSGKNLSPLEPANNYRPNFLAGNQTKLNGQMTVKFENAPPGTRVDVGKTNQSGVGMNADVGYRRMALL